MSDELRLVGQLGAVVQLGEVRMLRALAELKTAAYDGQLHADIDQSYDWSHSEDSLICQVGCDVLIKDVESDTEVFVCGVTFGAVYVLPDGADFSDEAFEAFTARSATFSLHPYLREAVQSLTTRAGLPPLVLATVRSPILGEVGATPKKASAKAGSAKRTPLKKAAVKKTDAKAVPRSGGPRAASTKRSLRA